MRRLPVLLSIEAAFAAATILLCCSGCALLSKPQLAACQTEKQALLARIKQDQDRLVAAEARANTAVARLAESEKQLARLHDGVHGGTQWAADDSLHRVPAQAEMPPHRNVAESPQPNTAESGQRTATRDDGWNLRSLPGSQPLEKR